MYGSSLHLDALLQKPQAQEEQEKQGPEAVQEKSSSGGGFSLPGFPAKVRALGLHLMLVMGHAGCQGRVPQHGTYPITYKPSHKIHHLACFADTGTEAD